MFKLFKVPFLWLFQWLTALAAHRILADFRVEMLRQADKLEAQGFAALAADLRHKAVTATLDTPPQVLGPYLLDDKSPPDAPPSDRRQPVWGPAAESPHHGPQPGGLPASPKRPRGRPRKNPALCDPAGTAENPGSGGACDNHHVPL
jgi:hypothetical protein